jgi:hypothetical protein
LYVGGVGGATTIAKILDAKKYKPRNSNSFTKATLKDMLKNPVYVGLIRWGKVMVPGLHEPLIDKETFERAQQIAKTNYHAPTKVSLELQNPLAGLVYCKKCGSLMTRLAEHPRNKYATLKCPNTNCSNVSAPLYLVEQEILSNLKNWLYVYSMNLNEDSLNPAFEKIKEERALISKLQSELKKVAAQIAKTHELLEQEVYTVDVFLERNQTLKQKQDELLSKIALSETEISNQEQTSCITLSHAEELLNSYSTSDPAADRNQILKLLVSRITYNKDTPNRRGQLERRNFEIEIFPILPTKNN